MENKFTYSAALLPRPKNQLPTVIQRQADELQFSNLPFEVKEKIRLKYVELSRKYPKMKAHRLMRKAGEFYGVQINFV